MQILFVCSGNTCRSPMAEAWLRNIIQNGECGKDSNITVSSAGLFAEDGEVASQGAIRAMKRRGIDISSHRARVVSEELLNEADLILCMSAGHCEALEYSVGKEKKLMTLRGLAYGDEGPHASIVDPFLGDDEVYEVACVEICEAINTIISKNLINTIKN